MKLSILICTVPWRDESFLKLLDILMPQVAQHEGKIEVLAYWNTGHPPVSQIRTALVKEAKGDYVCFVDDDDMVPDYYCDEILKAVGQDYIGFRVKYFEDEVEKPPVFHSVHHGEWFENDEGYFRDITHLNPIKRSIALQGNFGLNREAGEDQNWSKTIAPLVKTENYIDKVMYFYYHNKHGSSFGGDRQPRRYWYRRQIFYKHFRYHPDCKEEAWKQ